MSNLETYQKTFTTALSINSDDFKDTLEYNGVPEWDSIGHMTLISALEEAFNIAFETDDIVDYSSYKKGIDILKKYKIDF
jgi:acyl carrier protein